jgi:hypothetical protein
LPVGAHGAGARLPIRIVPHFAGHATGGVGGQGGAALPF